MLIYLKKKAETTSPIQYICISNKKLWHIIVLNQKH